MEAGGQLAAIEEDALGWNNWSEVRASRAANARVAGLDGLSERSELLRVVAIGAEGAVRLGCEGSWKGVGGRCGMRLGGVVDGSCNSAKSVCALAKESEKGGSKRTRNCSLANELDRGDTLSVVGGLAQSSGGKHGCGCVCRG